MFECGQCNSQLLDSDARRGTICAVLGQTNYLITRMQSGGTTRREILAAAETIRAYTRWLIDLEDIDEGDVCAVNTDATNPGLWRERTTADATVLSDTSGCKFSSRREDDELLCFGYISSAPPSPPLESAHLAPEPDQISQDEKRKQRRQLIVEALKRRIAADSNETK